jgi:dipeptidyl-peptidase-4
VVEDSSVERPTRELWHARLAQRGYVVVAADNPASAFFGKHGADRLHRRFGRLELEAQLAVVEHLKRQPWVDPARIGLWGWSGGGANTLYSVLHSPGTWRAAVAGAPVTDWRLYDSIWTERYLDHPGDNPDGYRDSSAVTAAAKLADALLVVHGTGDDNVHPHHTMALTRELVKAGRPFEQAIYPGEKHAFSDTANRHFYERMEAFFDRWLKAK